MLNSDLTVTVIGNVHLCKPYGKTILPAAIHNFKGGGTTAADVKIKFTVSHIKPGKLNNTTFSFPFMFKSFSTSLEADNIIKSANHRKK